MNGSTGVSSSSSSTFHDKVRAIDDILSRQHICIDSLREVCITGVPEHSNKRDICWKVLLGYLPLERAKWDEQLREKRQLYNDYMHEFIVQPGQRHNNTQQPHDNNQTTTSTIAAGAGAECGVDHPLSVESGSEWQQYFSDNSELLQQIDKDCRRLFPDYSFFHRPTQYPATPTPTPSSATSTGDGGGGAPHNYVTLRRRVEMCVLQAINLSHDRYGIELFSAGSHAEAARSYTLADDEQETHWEVVERMLFIYAKLNKATGYVQGMNELAGPIYHVFATSRSEESRQFAEADSFFCFVNLMAENRDLYTKSMDNSKDGILGKFNHLHRVLKTVDYQLYLSLKKQQVHPQFYAFRWLSLLFTQEFNLADVERLWDTLLSDRERFQHAIFVAVAMLTLERSTILQDNFNHTMHTLQHYNQSVDDTLKQCVVVIDLFNKHEHVYENSESIEVPKDSSSSSSSSFWNKVGKVLKAPSSSSPSFDKDNHNQSVAKPPLRGRINNGTT